MQNVVRWGRSLFVALPGSDDDAEPKWCGRFAHDVLDGTYAANDL